MGMARLEKAVENVSPEIQDNVLAELKRIKAIKWFRPLELNEEVREKAGYHVNEALKLSGSKVKYKVVYRELSAEEDWKAAGKAAMVARKKPGVILFALSDSITTGCPANCAILYITSCLYLNKGSF